MKKGRSQRKPSGSRPTLSGFLRTVLIMAVVAFAGLFAAHRFADPRASFGTTITQIFSPVQAPQELFHKDRLAILLLGIDYNYNDKDQEYSDGARSDTIMALSLDLPTHSLHVLSIPRDMRYTYPDGHVEKINAAFSLGGPKAAERAVANFLGIPAFDRYIVLRINATKALINAIGGIDVPVTETLNYDDNWGHLHIHFKPGLTHMDGEQAVSYSRFRHDACSDPCRIRRQQQVMRLTIAKLKNDKLNDLGHISQLITVANQNVLTDLSAPEKLSLASAYSSFNIAALKSEQVPYTDDQVVANGGDVLIPDDAAKSKLVHQLFLADVEDPTATPDPAALAAIHPSQVHILIENGSGVSGLGQTVADVLQKAGYVIDHVGNAATFDHDATEVHVSDKGKVLAQVIKQRLALHALEIDTDVDDAIPGQLSVRVVVGRDVAALVSTAATTASTRKTP